MSDFKGNLLDPGQLPSNYDPVQPATNYGKPSPKLNAGPDLILQAINETPSLDAAIKNWEPAGTPIKLCPMEDL